MIPPWATTLLGRWTVGLFFSLLVGAGVIALFFYILKYWTGPAPKDRRGKYVPAAITGVVERLFFTVLVGGSNDPSGVPALMFVWIGAKIAANWGHKSLSPYPSTRTFTIRALIGGLLSMLFALVGGMIARGKWIQQPRPTEIPLPPF